MSMFFVPTTKCSTDMAHLTFCHLYLWTHYSVLSCLLIINKLKTYKLRWKYQVLTSWLKDQHKMRCPTCQWYVEWKLKKCPTMANSTSQVFLFSCVCNATFVLRRSKDIESEKAKFFIDTFLVQSANKKWPHNSILFPWNVLEILGYQWNLTTFTDIFNALPTHHCFSN